MSLIITSVTVGLFAILIVVTLAGSWVKSNVTVGVLLSGLSEASAWKVTSERFKVLRFGHCSTRLINDDESLTVLLLDLSSLSSVISAFCFGVILCTSDALLVFSSEKSFLSASELSAAI